MEDTLRDFQKRQLDMRRKHARMARGYVTKLDKNGVIVQKPDSKSSGRLLRTLAMVGLVFFGFKVLLFAGLGVDTYSDHLARLQQGSGVEQAGAWLMQIDPLTERLAALVSPFFF